MYAWALAKGAPRNIFLIIHVKPALYPILVHQQEIVLYPDMSFEVRTNPRKSARQNNKFEGRAFLSETAI